ncbi:SusC/RagA family TonB-linked outer membrane protein [Chitinophaga oryzae]|uniref:SusC/RagA family TonB-linked outer membrane protein n=1 Tax=Chitinophaga oryzae TaxID=2725414 RepID=A0AAE6ZH47_9BACT|nr:SusC/RagA family TonB-linked outer membrane protein [Chitinophaga oryzae]QJB32576.1 SusC/RagA family TonB-linked outer membrane protein [Chitinophaga oryzae]
MNMELSNSLRIGGLYALTKLLFLGFMVRRKRLLLILGMGLVTVWVVPGDAAAQDASRKPVSSARAADSLMMVSGKVADEKGNALPGVVVRAENSKKGAVTGNLGEFTIAATPADKLAFTLIGYAPVVKNVNGAKHIGVIMKQETKGLKELVVTGFQEIDKKKFAGASTRLKAEDIRMDGVTDVSRALEGKAAGVSVQSVSATFGSAPKVRIRGVTSLTGENKPLWVVDGIALEDVMNVTNDQLSSGDPSTLLSSSVAGLNMNDIEDMYILKDAAATSLYGARAMNGVVVINTKKGRSGKVVTNYTGNFSTQLKPSYNNFNIMNSAEQMSVNAEMARKGLLNLADLGNQQDRGVYGKMYNDLNIYDPVTGKFQVENTVEGRKAYLQRYVLANTDWFNILFRNSLIQEHTLSLSGGSEKMNSYFSAGFYNDNGWTVADKVKRFTFNAQNNYTFSDKLSVGFIATGSVRQQDAPGTVSRTSDAFYGKMSRDFDINPYNFALNTSRALTAYGEDGNPEFFTRGYAPFNILHELEHNKLKLSVIDLKLQGTVSYKITKHLKYDFLGAIRYTKADQEDLVNENSNKAQAYRAAPNSVVANANRFLYKDPDHPNSFPQIVLPVGGLYNRSENSLTNYNFRNSLNYTETFGKHDLNVLVGQEVKFANRQNATNTGYGYQYDYGGSIMPNYLMFKKASESDLPYFGMQHTYDRYAAFYATAGYTYNSRYNFTGAIRTDGSNRLGKSPSARWLPTWSVSGAWNLDQEEFLKNARSINMLKLRASYGLTADMGVATNSAVVLRTFNTPRQYARIIESAIAIDDLENADLTWEKQYSLNVGVDAALFDSRLTTSIDLYKKNGFDLIAGIKTSGIGGQSVRAINYANMSSKGVELTIGAAIIRSTDIGWKTSLTLGYNKNKITNARNTPIIFDQVVPEGGNKNGYPVSSLFSLDYQGMESNTGIPLFIDEKGEVSRKVNLQDVETKYLVYEGPVDPPVSGGFSNTFRFKGLSLNVLITYQAGNKIRLNPVFKSAYSDLDAFPREFLDRWTLAGDEQRTNVPSIIDALTNYRMTDAYPYNNYNYSSARVADGGFIRLKNIALSYLLPVRMVKNIGLSNLSVTASANNLWLLYSDSKLRGQDPEFFNAGGVAQPLQRQLVMSLKVTL